MLKRVANIALPGNAKPGGFDHAAVHLASATLYVAHTCNDSIELINTVEDRHIGTIDGHPGVAGALVGQDSNLVFTSDRAAGTVSFFHHGHPELKRVVAVGGKPNGLAYAPSHMTLLAANVGKMDGTPGITVSFVNASTAMMITDVEVPGRTRWSLYDGARDKFYVNIADPAQILVFDASMPSNAPESISVDGEGPHGLDFEVKSNRLFCACDGGQFIAFDLDSRNEVARASLAGVPDVIFVNEALRRVYVTIGDPGVIQVFDTGSLKLLEEVETEHGAHTIGFDSARNKVYAFLPQSCQAAVFLDS